jgi:hypothetical protein
MTRDDIIRMAREVGLLFDNTLRAPTPRITQKQKDIERFAALVAAAEREECAQIVEQYCGAWNDQGYALAQAIRARGEK